jgi:hypothetical protein
MGIDLSVIWFVIIVFATLMYIVMDGFDLGIGILFSATRDAEDRDVMVNSVAPVWDGNDLAGAWRRRAVRRVSPRLCGDYRCAGDPADVNANRPDFSRRGV